MLSSGLNTNRDRAAFWQQIFDERGKAWLELALSQIDPTTAQVLTWYYIDRKSFKEITALLNRSISIARNHHNRGIFELQQYYVNGLNSV